MSISECGFYELIKGSVDVLAVIVICCYDD